MKDWNISEMKLKRFMLYGKCHIRTRFVSHFHPSKAQFKQKQWKKLKRILDQPVLRRYIKTSYKWEKRTIFQIKAEIP